MFNHHRGLWGYTGAAADGEPLTIQATGMGGPVGGDRAHRADRAGRAQRGPRRHLRRARRRARARRARVAREAICADGTSRALGAGERVAADGCSPRRSRAPLPSARARARSSASTCSTRTAGPRRRRTRRSRSRWRPRALFARRPPRGRAGGLRARGLGHVRRRRRAPRASTTTPARRRRADGRSARSPRCSRAERRLSARRRAPAACGCASPRRRPSSLCPAAACVPLPAAAALGALCSRRRPAAALRGYRLGLRRAGRGRGGRRRACCRERLLELLGDRPQLRLDRGQARLDAARAQSARSSRSTPSSMPSRRCETERRRRVSRSMSAAEGMLSAPIATSCACAAFSRASNARPMAPVSSGLSSSSRERPAEPVLGVRCRAARAGSWRRCSDRTSLCSRGRLGGGEPSRRRPRR